MCLVNIKSKLTRMFSLIFLHNLFHGMFSWLSEYSDHKSSLAMCLLYIKCNLGFIWFLGCVFCGLDIIHWHVTDWSWQFVVIQCRLCSLKAKTKAVIFQMYIMHNGVVSAMFSMFKICSLCWLLHMDVLFCTYGNNGMRQSSVVFELVRGPAESSRLTDVPVQFSVYIVQVV